ncbi:hypothetical protein QT236_12580 [Geobacillus stearothermophilus]|nr:hypothetical protein QT236_12580 [Geobacillus stearothermophilus]
MAKYRKKPIIVEAFQLTEELLDKKGWTDEYVGTRKIKYRLDHAIIQTLEGEMIANIGDYIITGINGEIYPCKPDIFEKTYEPVKEDDA